MNGVQWVRALCDEFISCRDFASIQAVPNYRHTLCYDFHDYHHNMATKMKKKKNNIRVYELNNWNIQNIIAQIKLTLCDVQKRSRNRKNNTKWNWKLYYTMFSICLTQLNYCKKKKLSKFHLLIQSKFKYHYISSYMDSKLHIRIDF